MTLANLPPAPTKNSDFSALFWWATLVAKLALASLIPFFADEAYYWVWGQKPDWSFFDHPPMIGWWFTLADHLGFTGTFNRWPGVIMAHGALWVWIRILRENFPEVDLRTWLWLYLLCPFTGLAGLAMTPDLPLSLFWALATFFALRFLRDGDLRSATGLGFSLGAGFLSKYMIVLFPLALVPLMGNASIRRRVFSWPVLCTVLSGALLSLPVLWWNRVHEGLSFSFQLKHGLQPSAWHWSMTGEYLFGVCLVLLPVLPSLFRFSLVARANTLLLFATGLTPFLFFALTSLRAPVELNWPMMGLPALLTAIAWSKVRTPRWGRFYYGALSFLLALALVLPSQINPVKKAHEATRYEVLLPFVQEYQPLFASSYQMASVLWFRSSRPVYKLRGSRRFDMYDLWPESLPEAEVFYFARERGDRWPEAFPQSAATLIRQVDDFELWEMRKK